MWPQMDSSFPRKQPASEDPAPQLDQPQIIRTLQKLAGLIEERQSAKLPKPAPRQPAGADDDTLMNLWEEWLEICAKRHANKD